MQVTLHVHQFSFLSRDDSLLSATSPHGSWAHGTSRRAEAHGARPRAGRAGLRAYILNGRDSAPSEVS